MTKLGGEGAHDGVDGAQSQRHLGEDTAKDGHIENPREAVETANPCGNPLGGVKHSCHQQGDGTSDDQCIVDFAADEGDGLDENNPQ